MQQAAQIAAQSFTIIRAELSARGIQLAPPLAEIVERVIHSSADFEFATLTRASPGAVEAGVAALRSGCAIITDVRMVQVGISARRLAAWGGAVHCFVAEPEVAARAAATGLTRGALGVRLAHEHGLLDGGIVVVGNAPTALYETIRLLDAGARPALVVGVPVGFVNTAESKEALMACAAVPWIVTTGRKGGSTIAVAMLNALLRLAAGADNAEVD